MELSGVPVNEFLQTVSEKRRGEAERIITVMRDVTGEEPAMWGPSIIGFGHVTYTTSSGIEGEMGAFGFSPRKAQLTIYVPEGFDRHGELLDKLGKHRTSVSCLYINKLDDVDFDVLTDLMTRTYRHHELPQETTATDVESYLASVPAVARPKLDELRALVREVRPGATEVFNYGILGYKLEPKKRALVFVSGWKDHVAVYPVPKDPDLVAALEPYRRGKGTLWFPLDADLPAELIKDTVEALFNA